MAGSLGVRVRKLERELESTTAAASVHFLEIRTYIEEALRSRFAALDKRLGERFAQIDQRFDQIDQRFDQIDQRFDQIDQRFDRLEAKLDLFIDTQGGINRAHHRRLSTIERRAKSGGQRKR
jgi:hypothetical protein